MDDGEIHDTKFDCRLDLALPLHWRRMVVKPRIICASKTF
jgi:hypothetical protein